MCCLPWHGQQGTSTPQPRTSCHVLHAPGGSSAKLSVHATGNRNCRAVAAFPFQRVSVQLRYQNVHPCLVTGLCMSVMLRRHKLPTPHLALRPTEVHVVVRGKVCGKGCYFLGIQTPLVATCQNKVCISNICRYLHFWKDTYFQNKDIQSPKYSVVLHLEHCIPVPGGGLRICSLPSVPG